MSAAAASSQAKKIRARPPVVSRRRAVPIARVPTAVISWIRASFTPQKTALRFHRSPGSESGSRPEAPGGAGTQSGR